MSEAITDAIERFAQSATNASIVSVASHIRDSISTALVLYSNVNVGGDMSTNINFNVSGTNLYDQYDLENSPASFDTYALTRDFDDLQNQFLTNGDNITRIQHKVRKRELAAEIDFKRNPKDTARIANVIRYPILSGKILMVTGDWYSKEEPLARFTQAEYSILAINNGEIGYNMKFIDELASLYEGRAPLLRDKKMKDKSNLDFEQAIYLAKGINGPNALEGYTAAIYFIHNSTNPSEEYQRQIKIDTGQKNIENVDSYFARYKGALFALLLYLQGEGEKRKAYNKEKDYSMTERCRCAQRAIEYFEQHFCAVRKHHEYFRELFKPPMAHRSETMHELVALVGVAQCLLLLDQDKAVRLLNILKHAAVQYCPSLLGKIEKSLASVPTPLYLYD